MKKAKKVEGAVEQILRKKPRKNPRNRPGRSKPKAYRGQGRL